jgi:hypothetical protein
VRVLIALFLALGAPPAFGAEPFARSALEQTGAIVPGQQLRLTVDVFAPGFFTSPPDLPLFDIAGALVTLPEERGQNMVETVDGTQYSGIRRQYAVVPEHSGWFSVPAITIEFTYSADGTPTKARVNTAATSFQVTGIDKSGALYSASDVEISQSFDRNPADLKEGDALVRTIVISGKETQAMLMPPVDVGKAVGLKQYSKPPKLADGVAAGRGETVSTRTDTIVYTADRTGEFDLPEVRYEWYDVDGSDDTYATLSPTHIVVTAAGIREGIAPELASAKQPGFEQRRIVAFWILVSLGLGGVVWMLRGIPDQLRNFLVSLRQKRLGSERHRIHALRQTVLSQDLSTVYAALQAWAVSGGYNTLRDRVANLPGLSNEVRELEKILFSGREGKFDRQLAANALSQIASSKQQLNKAPLPDLNPSG